MVKTGEAAAVHSTASMEQDQSSNPPPILRGKEASSQLKLQVRYDHRPADCRLVDAGVETMTIIQGTSNR